MRRIVSSAFSPRRINAIEEDIERVGRRLIDRVATLGECDFVTELAAPLPLEIICDMMGLPPSEHATVLRCSNIFASSSDDEILAPGEDPLEAMVSAGCEMVDLLTELSTHRREHPADDLTTALISTNIDGEALTPAEVASFFILLLTAGNETTRNSLSHGLLALTEHPDQRAVWQADPLAVAATGVDEVVRWASPVNWMRRTVTEETVLSGEVLHPGDKVLLFYGSANRDEDVFEDPYTFDVRRSPNPHVGFGAAGPHFCLGAHLARREIDVMMRQLLVRLPDIDGGRRAGTDGVPLRERHQPPAVHVHPYGSLGHRLTGRRRSPGPVVPRPTGPGRAGGSRQGLATISTPTRTRTTTSPRPIAPVRPQRAASPAGSGDAAPSPAVTAATTSWRRRSSGHRTDSATTATSAQPAMPSDTQVSAKSHVPPLIASRATPNTGTRNSTRPAQLTPGR